ncbi:MAG: ATP-dependent DNA helicase RecG [Clostridiales bacterium]|nr:ATP-dependent DNA helicase RecG [Clostridiales bacterium]
MKQDSPIKALKGIGPKTEKLFQTLGVYTVCDLLLYFPRDYERCPAICGIGDLIPERKNAVYIRAPGTPAVNQHSGIQTTVLDVGGGGRTLRIIWFRSPYIRSVVKAGGMYVFYGRVSVKNGLFYMEQPEILSPDQYRERLRTLQPVYSLTRGLTNRQIQKTVRLALDDLPAEMEYLPEDIRARHHLSEYSFALEHIHMPADEQSCIRARERFVFDEFFLFLLCMQLTKDQSAALKNEYHFVQPGMCGEKDFSENEDRSFGYREMDADRSGVQNNGLNDSGSFVSDIIRQLPYKLTRAQRRTAAQIQTDMRSDRVMQRLIQGDVGSGKTILAFLAMLDCANSGYQSAIMAPTDVLARQHAGKLRHLCGELGLPFPVVLLTGSLGAAQRREAYAAIEREPDALIVGTHALIQEKVNYRSLALVITDEQHRFGVKQRESFAFKGRHPHILVMSATPIPRTLAIILYGDLEISVLDEVPAARKPVKNCVVDISFREKAYRFMESQIREGHQVYVICPLVEPSEYTEGENVLEYTERLKRVFPEEIQISCLHGKMKPEEKNRLMEDFLANRIQILVSTTVIEVGVDVPNATVMMIENAERFGLAQLHQLRGRVGRGDAQSYCIFMQGNGEGTENRRLAVLNRSNDGFFIAGEDLKLRGPGDFFGIRQSGDFRFRLADIYQDADVMGRASDEVSRLLREDPGLEREEHRALRQRLRMYAGEDFSLLNL